MANPVTRISFLNVVLLLGLAGIVGRAVQLQVVEGDRWRAQAERTRTETRSLPARRGTLYDRQGSPLAISQEKYRVGVAPWEVPARQADTVARLLVRDLDFPRAKVREAFRAVRQGEHYLYRYAPATASQVEALRRYRGIRLEPVYLRTYPSGPLARDLIGALEADSGRGRSGIERAMDHLLAGVPGLAGFLRDRRGVLYESPDRLVRSPVAGHDVHLTLDAELQGIAEAALAQTLDEQQADAGDVVLIEPATGEVLALASQVRRPAGERRVGAWTPSEPGSTIKPFAAAGLLALGRAAASDSVHGENGVWQVDQRRRPIRDTHPRAGWLTLAQAIQVSSNVATTKFTLRLRPEEHYDVLRDFGFGTPTGLELPFESAGILKRPHAWNPGNTQPSMAQGYELEVTPLQLAAAYAALANDGLLPSLTLVREIRNPEGRVVYRHRPAPVRRVVSAGVAAQVRGFLRDAASAGGGTGSRAQLATYRVIGKTGTAKNVVGGTYASGQYTASFAGMFPEEDPQLVFVVRIVNPQAGEYYGGLVAAPLTRRMLQNALAARRSGIDRSRLALRSATESTVPAPAPVHDAAPIVMPVTPASAGARPPAPMVAVPDVIGLPVRRAALQLHQRGLRVRMDGRGTVRSMSPAAGDSARAGSAIRLVAGAGG